MGKLLDRALAFKPKFKRHDDNVTKDEIELFTAWLNGDVTKRQVTIACGRSPSYGTLFLLRVFEHLYHSGKLREIKPNTVFKK